MKRITIKQILLLIMTLMTLTVTVFAWFAISDQVNVNNFLMNTSDFSMDLKLKINDEEKITKQEIKDILANAKPSDEFNFELEIKFTGNVSNYEANILLYKINASNENILEDFYIKEGKVYNGEVEEELNDLENLKLSNNEDGDILLIKLSLSEGDIIILSFTLVFDEESTLQNQNITINGIVVKGD